MGRGAWEGSNPRDDINHKYWDIKVILFFFKLIGLAPLEILRSDYAKKVSDKQTSQIPVRLKFVCFRSGLVYNVILTIIYLPISFICVPRLYRTHYGYTTDLTASAEVVQTVFRITLMNALWLLTSIKRDRMASLLNRLIEVDSTISRVSGFRWRSVCRLRVISVFIVLMIVWIFLTISDRLAYNTTLLDCFNDIVPSFVINLFIFQYALIVEFTEIQYRNLNSALVSLSTFPIVRTFRSFTNHGEITLTNHDYFPKIIDFRRAHNTLYEIGSDIADFYSLPILLIIPLCCLEIIYSAYSGLLPLTRDLGNDRTFEVTSSVAWVLVLITPVAVLAKRVDGITNEVSINSS
ncbi:uncharacterized protein [Venturia canescens]|uniref:uncharacterized protein n=1 Tax=Venturia canescens TaxID=32260 RepID=UPI001C9CCB6B|nr:uncharacterized protein LOC122416775 [Venturia canescens]